jgi:hypothetical protein
MRAAILITLVLAWFLTSTTSIAQPAAPAPQIVTVMLRNFAFGPDHLRLLAGSPIQLRLTNQGSGSHNFSAPGFFAASRFPLGVTSPAGGMVEVGV